MEGLEEASNISAEREVISEENLPAWYLQHDNKSKYSALTRFDIAVLKRTRRVSSCAERSKLCTPVIQRDPDGVKQHVIGGIDPTFKI